MTDPPSKRMFPPYLLIYVAVAALIAVAGNFVFRPLHAKTPAAMTPDAIAARLAPVGRLETEGYKAMPPKGGGADLDPVEVARAVAWMADQGGANFKAP